MGGGWGEQLSDGRKDTVRRREHLCFSYHARLFLQMSKAIDQQPHFNFPLSL